MNESIETESVQPYHVSSRLYMFECIELELGISADDTTDLYSSPICLYTDPYVPSRLNNLSSISYLLSTYILYKHFMQVLYLFQIFLFT